MTTDNRAENIRYEEGAQWVPRDEGIVFRFRAAFKYFSVLR